MLRVWPAETGGVLLSGHTDVVPIEGQNWTRPAFALTQEEDRLYGRGTTDMRGISGLYAFGCRSGVKIRASQTVDAFAFHDEEVGCTGIQEMKPFLIGNRQPNICVVTNYGNAGCRGA